MPKKPVTTKRALLTSFSVNIIDIVTNAAVAAVTGSTVMLAEALQGFADLMSVGFLMVGHRRSHKQPDHNHPFGYGKEVYFWSTMAAFMILAVTATMSVYFGWQKFARPDPVEWVGLAYGVLVLAMATNSYSAQLSIRRLLEGRKLMQLARMLRESPLIAPKTAVVLDSMGTLAAVFGLASLAMYGLTGDARFDGIGAMVVGGLLAVSAGVLLFGLRGSITGRSVSRSAEQAIKRAAMGIDEVRDVLDLRTMMLGPESMIVNIEVHLRDNLTTDEVEAAIDEVKIRIDAAVPGITHVQVEPETPPKRHRHK